MSDFYQGGAVSLLHRLGEPKIEELETELERFARERPISLVLPVTYSDLHAPACKKIFKELRKVRYIREFIVALGVAEKRQNVEEAKELVSILPSNHVLIWCNGPGMRKLYELLERHELKVGETARDARPGLHTAMCWQKGSVR